MVIKRLSGDSDHKIKMLNEECQRLNGVIEKRNLEIRELGGTIHKHEETIRLSTTQATRMTTELNDLKNRYGVNTQELDSYKARMQKLVG